MLAKFDNYFNFTLCSEFVIIEISSKWPVVANNLLHNTELCTVYIIICNKVIRPTKGATTPRTCEITDTCFTHSSWLNALFFLCHAVCEW